jgi:CRISPR/Cas system-associated exonuclease Cas4 (RecB family)
MNNSSVSKRDTAYKINKQDTGMQQTIEMKKKKGEFLIPTLMNALYEHYNEPRANVHISDLTLCVREQAFRRIDPTAIETRDLNYFILGKSSHEAAQILAKRFPNRFEAEKEVIYEGVQAHVDLYDKVYNVPFEMKTYRGKDPSAPKAHQLTQVMAYMAMLGASRGYVVFLLMNNFEEPLFKEFEVTMDAEERKNMLEWIVINAKAFEIAVNHKDAELAPHIYYDSIVNKDQWKCRYCKYQGECSEMRAREPERKITK